MGNVPTKVVSTRSRRAHGTRPKPSVEGRVRDLSRDVRTPAVRLRDGAQPHREVRGGARSSGRAGTKADVTIQPGENPLEAKRVEVNFDYAAVNPEFLKMLAEIESYGDAKYG